MNHNLLVAVDGSPPSEQAVRYGISLGLKIPIVTFTLCHIEPPFLSRGEADTPPHGAGRRDGDHKADSGPGPEDILGDCHRLMTAAGIPSDRIDIHRVEHRQGTAKDLLTVAQQRRCAAILIGRRRISRLKSVFMGSVTAGLLESGGMLPIWVVEGSVVFRSILLAVDGSENSLRATEHLSSMLAGAPDITITLFHVSPRFADSCPLDVSGKDSPLATLGQRGSKHCIDNFHQKAMDRFLSAGLTSDRIALKTANALLSPGKAILAQAEAGNHDTIIIGRRGLSRSFFAGSVSRYVTGRASGQAIWVVS
jgi:nucleotide-binding universal stress UspA family protein